ncbi:MAG: bifunctional DNA primase/polymerase, partial [Xanthobacteraceae bacterium]
MSDVLTPQKEASWQIMDRATTQRKLLLAAGYVPIPINGKAPIIPEWQKQQPTAGDVDKWPQLYPCAFNTGILTRATPTVDVDVYDAAVVEELRNLLWDVVGDSGRAMVRVGRPPKCAIPFQTDQPFAKLSTPIFTSPDGR